ncbi:MULTISPECIES: Eco57I restriction-modification methylase domain-containing protein [Thalassospira]|jgi:site-specific DNA-methyltransferase (adenine-specific)|uniref:site-specific DNA-methyltransferase (adenine-specific) n=1 Tax=Thalassospira xiamenensis TaxID=220697 RepID=A0ABR5Y1M3_9PROT|nr:MULTISPECIES: Eco57I restriction-modification methylase domain-containing protein [Thalassospira]MAL29287.1 restriction endonuclease [Thalassospira sp.]MBR9780071.1 restriction endonuclease [Rhodospirillales bacterium]KZD03595.1 restriction endonuclease [Thalassospira xiamenensis]KZD08625.1 restriction endonuclease [Thalassospira xiamenensis]MBL4842200.1 Eco57I restriction-modification methylase domain-containing protein [Thalassospira sp.]|tara:strand:- start:3278 stop:4861 length:1584 start_codon:yes stop_codon:yes gene_type:complete
MSLQASFSLRGRNPDVLTCIANLSNDEVFTPPEFANRMLDTLAEAWAADHNGANLWADKSVKFLDPCTKSGVFLREITNRLTQGLATEISDLQERVDHILTKQVFGIGITHLTSLLARRSLYCSKHANGEHSVAKSFDTHAGNIWFERTNHDWFNGRCVFCKASQSSYDREDGMETHAYAFIHTTDIEARVVELFGDKMQFDVIIGNPPYQLGSDGGTRDVPIYQRFVEQAKALQPRYLTMVIPSRWMASGLGLTEFRQAMLKDRSIRELIDFPAANDVFPGVEVKAGVCYFLWDASHDGDCKVTTMRGGEAIGPVLRNLGEYDIFVRDARAVSILHKVRAMSEPSINNILARDKEFGWTSNFDGFHKTKRPGDVPLYFIRKMKRGIGYIDRGDVTKSKHLTDYWKVLVPQAFNGGDAIPHQILGKPLIAPSPSVCTQSFLFFYVESLEAAKSIQSYYTTRFFRFLVSVRKITQHATHGTYTWVPMQTWDRNWTDEELYQKYDINEEEQAYIESQVRVMNIDDSENE